MTNRHVFEHLLQVRENRGGGFLLLIDPDRMTREGCIALAEAAAECGVDALLVGTSFMLDNNFNDAVKAIKAVTSLPVIIFPGSFAQLTPKADAVLFTSLLSGRNADYLIGEQVRGAPLIKRFGLETIPTGYMLVESGTLTSVQYISGTMPIPRTKFDIACAHALAAQYLGMKLAYFEAGSGAIQPVPVEMITMVASYIEIPIVVGGGLRTPEDCSSRIEAGASFVVVGNLMEGETGYEYLQQMTAATHPKEPIEV